jgi:hypothetical protein
MSVNRAYRTSTPGNRREARLRPEYANLYPGVRAGEWESAAVLADRVLAGHLLRGTTVVLRDRVLVDAHFEFRGRGEAGGERTRPSGAIRALTQ